VQRFELLQLRRCGVRGHDACGVAFEQREQVIDVAQVFSDISVT